MGRSKVRFQVWPRLSAAAMACALALGSVGIFLPLPAQSQDGVSTPGLQAPPKRPSADLQPPPKRPAASDELAPPPKRPSGTAGAAPAQRPATAEASPAIPPPERSDSPIAVDRVAAKVRAENSGLSTKLREREAQFQKRLSEAKSRVSAAQSKLARLESEGKQLEARFDNNKVTLDDKSKLLAEKIGALKELFGVFQQNASDLIGAFNGSPTSVQYPDRDVWLEGFANRMRNASEVSSTDDIKTLWFEMMREIEARGDIVRLTAPVYPYTPQSDDPTQAIDLGTPETREVVRVGGFNLISAEPRAEYLQWQAGRQHIEQMERQPVGPYLPLVEDYVSSEKPVALLSVDPTGGTLTELLAAKPTKPEQADQGGLVGYIIIGLGAVAFLLAVFKLVDIAQINVRVAAQRRRLDQPSNGNPLGRLLGVYARNRTADSEVLALRLDDQFYKEVDRIQMFSVFLVIIASVAPLLGLLGTVVGMIKTFQAITLFGTGDPQTMAGGISQALITTVLGLIVAVPAVLMNALVGSRAKAVIEVLAQHKALLLGDRIEAQYKAEHRQTGGGGGAMPSPSPA